MRSVWVAAPLMVVLQGVAAAEDAPAPADRKIIEACLESKTDATASCIGAVSQPCLDRVDDPSTAGMVVCFQRELLVWDALLNERFKALLPDLDATQSQALREVQRAWIGYRDKRCGFYWIYHGGSIAHPLAASCMAEETAHRAIDLGEIQQQ